MNQEEVRQLFIQKFDVNKARWMQRKKMSRKPIITIDEYGNVTVE